MKKTYLDFYYIIVDEDKKLYNCFIPCFRSALWDEKVVAAKVNDRNIHCYQVAKENIKDPINYKPGYKYTNEFLVDIPEDDSLLFKKKIPKYAEKADRKKIIEIVCDCGGRFGELNINFPGNEILQKDKSDIYTAKCLKCNRPLSNNYNWYRS